MKKVTKLIKYVFLTFVVILMILFVRSCISQSPLLPESTIKAKILNMTPIGVSKEEVLDVIAKNGELEGFSKDEGVLVYQGTNQPTRSTMDKSKEYAMIGEKSIIGTFGGSYYQTITGKKRVVKIFWAFDAEGKLIDLFVLRDDWENWKA